jgi:O-phosphoseryl-tRNA(Cys) synthetase
MVFILADFEDFREVAAGCDHVFYMETEQKSSVKVTAYAGRVCWQGQFTQDSADLDRIREVLTDMKAKQVEGDIDLEAVFR